MFFNGVCLSFNPSDMVVNNIKIYNRETISILTYVINLFFSSGKIPEKMKAANVTPIPKRKDIYRIFIAIITIYCLIL